MSTDGPLYPVVCLVCLYPLETAVGDDGGTTLLGLRHPDAVEDAHPVEPGYARACAFCAEEGLQWFQPYGEPGATRASGAVNVCATCRGLIERGDAGAVAQRAIGLLAPATPSDERECERERVVAQVRWLRAHRRGSPRLVLDLVARGAMGRPG